MNEKFEDLEKFENYKRSSETSMQQFLADFDQTYNRLKRQGTTICNDLLGFKLLKAANLSSQHEQLIKATITEVSYECIIQKIKSIFSNSTEKQVATREEFNIKTEPMFYTKNSTSDDDNEYDNKSVDDAVDTFYTPDK